MKTAMRPPPKIPGALYRVIGQITAYEQVMDLDGQYLTLTRFEDGFVGPNQPALCVARLKSSIEDGWSTVLLATPSKVAWVEVHDESYGLSEPIRHHRISEAWRDEP